MEFDIALSDEFLTDEEIQERVAAIRRDNELNWNWNSKEQETNEY